VTEVFEAKEKLLKELGWTENPFVKDLRTSDRETFMKYYRPFEAATILQKLAFDSKACLLLGPKGVGKTSALYYVRYSLPVEEFDVVFLKEPPQNLTELAGELGYPTKGGFVESLLSVFGRAREKTVSRAELINWLKKKNKKIALFVDEAHLEKNPEMYMEFKYLLDDVPNLRMIICALGKENFPDSLIQLIGETNVFQRKGFTEKEMLEIISHRIAAVGGTGLKPFPEAFLKEVFTERNLLSPRYVFDELNTFLAGLALGKTKWKGAAEYANDPIVQAAIARSLEEEREAKITTSHADWWVLLSPSQKTVLEVLLNAGGKGLTLSDIRAQTKLSENTAFNALYQLRGADEAERKRKPEVPFPLVQVQTRLVGGKKKNVYAVDEKIKNLFTMN